MFGKKIKKEKFKANTWVSFFLKNVSTVVASYSIVAVTLSGIIFWPQNYGSLTTFTNLLLRPCTLSFLKISLNQWRLAYRNWKLHLVFASLSKSLTTWLHLLNTNVRLSLSLIRLDVKWFVWYNCDVLTKILFLTKVWVLCIVFSKIE